MQLKREYDEAIAAGDKVKAAQVDEKIKARIAVLMHVYHTVAVHFADLHDTPERMLEKECISEIVPWRDSRRWLYWRLRRLLLEDAYIKKILRAQDNLSVGQAKQMLRRWLVEDKGATEVRLLLRLIYKNLNIINSKFSGILVGQERGDGFLVPGANECRIDCFQKCELC